MGSSSSKKKKKKEEDKDVGDDDEKKKSGSDESKAVFEYGKSAFWEWQRSSKQWFRKVSDRRISFGLTKNIISAAYFTVRTEDFRNLYHLRNEFADSPSKRRRKS